MPTSTAGTSASADSATIEEVMRRFAERTLVLCGGEFVRVKEQPAEAAPKLQLLECVHGRVCENVYLRLQACAKAQEPGGAKDACESHRQALNLCVQTAYSALPPPEVPAADVRQHIASLLGGGSSTGPGPS